MKHAYLYKRVGSNLKKMKKIIFIRHGKAVNKAETGKDFDRNLALKGKIQAHIIGHLLKEKELEVQQIYSSNSKRTTETISIISDIINYPLSKIEWKTDLYLCDLKTLLKLCFNLPKEMDAIVICGHNFGLTDCMNYFLDESYELSTCGTAIVKFDCNQWGEISMGMGKLEWMKLPKKIMD
jgi:phosphohistidine phosphatase